MLRYALAVLGAAIALVPGARAQQVADPTILMDRLIHQQMQRDAQRHRDDAARAAAERIDDGRYRGEWPADATRGPAVDCITMADGMGGGITSCN